MVSNLRYRGSPYFSQLCMLKHLVLFRTYLQMYNPEKWYKFYRS